MDIPGLIEKFGVSIGLLIYFIWRDYQTSKEHKADLKDIANKAVQSIDKSTESIVDSTNSIVKNTEVISNNSNILNTIQGVLLKYKGGSQDGNGN